MSIDGEIRSIIDRNYDRAEQILKDNMDILHAMTDALIKYETIDAGQIERLMNREEPGPPADWGGDDSSGTPMKSDSSSSDTASKDSKEDDADDTSVDDGAPSLH